VENLLDESCVARVIFDQENVKRFGCHQRSPFGGKHTISSQNVLKVWMI
jgi:hypothetical protein